MAEKVKSRKLNKGTEEVEEKNVNKTSSKKTQKKTLDDVLGKVDSSRSVALERRTRSVNKNLKGRKLKVTNEDLDEKKLDKEIENEDNLSITLMIVILLACFVVGGILGYMLYRIALNSSNVLSIVPYLFR